MADKQNGIAATVRALIEDKINSLGYDIWDVEYVKEGAFKYLRITIDSEGGIDIDDCEKVHREINTIIDEADPIEEQYFLEVSSPGVERELKRAWHFEKFIGETVVCKLYTAINGSKQLIGVLVSYDAGGKTLTVCCDGSEIKLDLKNVSKVNVYYDFENEDSMEDIK